MINDDLLSLDSDASVSTLANPMFAPFSSALLVALISSDPGLEALISSARLSPGLAALAWLDFSNCNS